MTEGVIIAMLVSIAAGSIFACVMEIKDYRLQVDENDEDLLKRQLEGILKDDYIRSMCL